MRLRNAAAFVRERYARIRFAVCGQFYWIKEVFI